MPLPNLFLVGAAKAGTTSAYDYLHQHPDIFMSRVKEPHFFSWEEDGWPQWAIKDREEYEGLFEQAGEAHMRGEASTWYLYSKTAAMRIHTAVPDAKIIALLRNPVMRAYSNWSRNVVKGRESALDFESALALEERRRQEPGPWHFHYFYAGLYYDQVRRYYEKFGRDNVLVLLYEDLVKSPVDMMKSIYEFLGVDSDFVPEVSVAHNKTIFPKSRRLGLLVETSNPLKSALKRVLPKGARGALKHVMTQVNQKERPLLSPALRERLNKAYEPDVEQLEVLLQRDLKSVWF